MLLLDEVYFMMSGAEMCVSICIRTFLCGFVLHYVSPPCPGTKTARAYVGKGISEAYFLIPRFSSYCATHAQRHIINSVYDLLLVLLLPPVAVL